MASLDSFKCQKKLTVGGKSYEYFSLKAAEKNGLEGDFAPAVLDEDRAGKSVAQRGRPHRQEGRHRGGRGLARKSRQEGARDRVPPGARADAGFHRRSRRRRSRRDARRDGQARRRSEKDQSAGAGRSRHRPFRRRRLFRHHQVARAERQARIRAEPGALSLPQMGPAGVLEFLRGAAGHRHLPSGQSRISRADRLDVEGAARRQARRVRLSRYAGRHRQPHHDGQRPRRARLGRRRHRGGSGDARPAAVDAAAGSRRLQADGRTARGRHRDRSRADRHADAAQERRGRQVRRVLRFRPQCDVGRRPRDARQHGA